VIARDIFGEPQFITLTNEVTPESGFFGEWVLLCGGATNLPLLARGEGWGPDYRTLMTLRETGATIRYRVARPYENGTPALLFALTEYGDDTPLPLLVSQNVWDVLPLAGSNAEELQGRVAASVLAMDCATNTMAIERSEYYTATAELLLLIQYPTGFERARNWAPTPADSSADMMRRAVCAGGEN